MQWTKWKSIFHKTNENHAHHTPSYHCARRTSNWNKCRKAFRCVLLLPCSWHWSRCKWGKFELTYIANRWKWTAKCVEYNKQLVEYFADACLNKSSKNRWKKYERCEIQHILPHSCAHNKWQQYGFFPSSALSVSHFTALCIVYIRIYKRLLPKFPFTQYYSAAENCKRSFIVLSYRYIFSSEREAFNIKIK